MTIGLWIDVSIYCYLMNIEQKKNQKTKHLLQFQYLNNKLKI